LSFTAQQIERQRRWRHLLLTMALLVLLAVLANGWLLGKDIYTLWTCGLRFKRLARDPAVLLQPGELTQAQADLEDIAHALLGLRAHLQPVLRPAWCPWRAVRVHLQMGDEALRMSAELAQVGRTVCEGFGCIVGVVASDHTTAEGYASPGASEALYTGLVAARPLFEESEGRVAQLHEDMVALAETDLWHPAGRVVSTLGDYLGLGRKALAAGVAGPSLLGAGQPAHYLILAQNSDELRATGGFITGIGLLTVQEGKICDLTFRDSFAYDKFTVDHPFAPEPMQRHMGIILWTTRDGNWSPDFPTAAQDVEHLYHLENTTEIDGLVALDIFALQTLVAAIGPVELDEWQDRVDGENVLQKIHEYWAPTVAEGMTAEERSEASAKWLYHRKDFMGMLGRALMAKLLGQGQPDQLGDLLWLVKRAIEERHIQLYFHEPRVQELLAVVGMDGALDRTHQGDYLLVLDTNMGYNKVNINVQQEVDYQVTLGEGTRPQATLTVTYHNRSPAQPTCDHHSKHAPTYDLMAQDCYWNYLRVYVPLGSELIASEGVTEAVTVADEEGKTVFATFFVVPTAETRTVRFIYRLPLDSTQEYRLLVQKQAGTDAVPLKVQVRLPPDARMLSAEREPSRSQQGWVSYDLNLRRDRSLVIQWH